MEEKKKLDKTVYLEKLSELSDTMESVENTPMGMYLKIINLIILNMRYEKIAFNKDLKEHPYMLTRKLIEDQIVSFKASMDVLFIESDKKDAKKVNFKMEEKHQDLWNNLWNKYDLESYEEKVERYKHRIKINNLAPLFRDKKCIDLGSGNGTFSVAMAEEGAKRVEGIDFGKESVEFAQKILKKRDKESKEKVNYTEASIYEIPFEDDTFDFAVQNGVFHHMEDELKAIEETKRVLKKGGYFWYYTDGEGGINYDLWDESVKILKEVPIEKIQEVTNFLNVSTNKSYHIGDDLKATYKHTSWDKMTEILRKKGFSNFKRMKGGFPTDMDGETVEKDPWAKEKFGEGDLRILAQLIDK